MTVDKCIVKGCINRKDRGNFIGDICAPCFSHITTGKIGPTTSFLGDMKKMIIHARKEYLKRNADIGIHDCPTPYDLYT